MSLVLNVEILGEFKKLTSATTGAQTELQKLNGKASKISQGINSALGAIGIGFSMVAVTRGLEDAAKAAIEDKKSMRLLEIAMTNTGNATGDMVTQAEKAISKFQIQSAVADDQLRPAYQKLFLATNDVSESNRLMQIALDTAAGSGKDLDAVTQAMAKSLEGNDTALVKLIPSLKGAKDPMAELETAFAGASEAAADTDPYARMQIILEDLQEQIGMSVLPLLEQFSTWLATPEGQAKLQEIVDFIKLIITELTNLATWVIDNKDWLLPVVLAIGGVKIAWEAVNGALLLVKATEAIFTTSSIANANRVRLAWLGAFGAAAAVVGVTAWGSETLKTNTGTSQKAIGGAFSINSTAKPSAGGSNMVINNVQIQGTQSAQQIANTLNKQLRDSGSSTVIRGGR